MNKMYQLVAIDDKFLADIGLADISVEEKKQAIEDIRIALESRVGVKLTQGLSDEQVDQFKTILSSDDQKAAMDWMENNIPNYREVVMLELDAIVDHIKHNNLSFINRL